MVRPGQPPPPRPIPGPQNPDPAGGPQTVLGVSSKRTLKTRDCDGPEQLCQVADIKKEGILATLLRPEKLARLVPPHFTPSHQGTPCRQTALRSRRDRGRGRLTHLPGEGKCRFPCEPGHPGLVGFGGPQVGKSPHASEERAQD